MQRLSLVPVVPTLQRLLALLVAHVEEEQRLLPYGLGDASVLELARAADHRQAAHPARRDGDAEAQERIFRLHVHAVPGEHVVVAEARARGYALAGDQVIYYLHSFSSRYRRESFPFRRAVAQRLPSRLAYVYAGSANVSRPSKRSHPISAASQTDVASERGDCDRERP